VYVVGGGGGGGITNTWMLDDAVFAVSDTLNVSNGSPVRLSITGSSNNGVARLIFAVTAVVCTNGGEYTLTGAFSGNGAGLTNLAAANVTGIGGDISGPLNNATVAGLRGYNVEAGPPSDGQLLQWSAASNAWIKIALTNLAAQVNSVTNAEFAIPALAWGVPTNPANAITRSGEFRSKALLLSTNTVLARAMTWPSLYRAGATITAQVWLWSQGADTGSTTVRLYAASIPAGSTEPAGWSWTNAATLYVDIPVTLTGADAVSLQSAWLNLSNLTANITAGAPVMLWITGTGSSNWFQEIRIKYGM
jgi:hypothetical protein